MWIFNGWYNNDSFKQEGAQPLLPLKIMTKVQIYLLFFYIIRNDCIYNDWSEHVSQSTSINTSVDLLSGSVGARWSFDLNVILRQYNNINKNKTKQMCSLLVNPLSRSDPSHFPNCTWQGQTSLIVLTCAAIGSTLTELLQLSFHLTITS